MEPIGKHWIIELYGCDPVLLSQPETVQAIMLEAAGAMHATVVTSTFHHFAPHGVSGVVVIMESHLTIHTWPEHGYAAVDIFTCGEMDTQKGLDLLAGKLQAGRNEVRLFERGLVGR